MAARALAFLPFRDRCLRSAATLAVALLSVLVTFGVWRQSMEAAVEKAHALFDQRVNELAGALAWQAGTYEQVLQGARGLFAANRTVGAGDWHAYAHELTYGAVGSELAGVFVLKVVTAADLDAFIAEHRREFHNPDYTLSIDGPSAVVLSYVEPASPILAADRDLTGDPAHVGALAQARDDARPAATGPLNAPDGSAGASGDFIIYLPLYRSDLPFDTVEHRREALLGYLGCAIRMRRMVQGAVASMGRLRSGDPLQGMAISISDVTDPAQPRPLYESSGTVGRPDFVRQVTLPVSGRQWMVQALSLPTLPVGEAKGRPGALTMAVAVFGLLLTGLTHILGMLLHSRAELHVAYTRLAEREIELDRLAHSDPLTGLANRRHFFQMGTSEWHRARRHDRPLSVLMIDIDHFKAINDTHGHGVGDETLRLLAVNCKTTLRDCDVMARMGGEEFAVILTDTEVEAAAVVAERLRRIAAAVSVPTFEGGALSVAVSIGVASMEPDDETLDDLIRRADQALYSAKAAGRNQVVTVSGSAAAADQAPEAGV